jgi:hypothetical protein
MSLPVDKTGLDVCTARNARNQIPVQSNQQGGKIMALNELQWVACLELIKNV